MLIEDLYNYNHKLAKTSLILKSLYVFPAFVLSIFSNEIIFHASIFIGYFAAIMVVSKPSILKLLKLFLLPGAFIFIGCFTLLLSINFSGNLKNFISIDKETYPLAIAIFFRSYAIVSVVYFWLLTNTISEIAALMYRCKIPNLFVELFVLVYKFIHLLMHTTKAMLTAQKCRMGYTSTRKNSINSFAYLFGAVFKKSMQQTEQLELAMDARLGNNSYVFVKPLQNFKMNELLMPLTLNIVIVIAFIMCIQ
ncbi:MAG: hypothetical protein KBE41_01105 [Lutibacter sp.]|nr:hypothetical protein [Lutibacter sp.]MBP9600072.1 hypothetical protein [Lutibacter sp.]